jgi:uncharacterized phage protein (TIGR01671 family)
MNNRIYKFRAWDKKNKRMLNWNEMIFREAIAETPEMRMVRFRIDLTENFLKNIQREFDLMQFTGLLDSEEKEIYEGDIIQYVRNKDGYICHHKPRIVKWENCQNKNGFNITNGNNYKIIGHIYENPISKITDI